MTKHHDRFVLVENCAFHTDHWIKDQVSTPGAMSSILIISTPYKRIQVNISPAQCRGIASMLQAHAMELDIAMAEQRITT